MPRRSSAGAPFCICKTFSSSDIRETRSCARVSAGRSGFLYGSCADRNEATAKQRSNRMELVVAQNKFGARHGRSTQSAQRTQRARRKTTAKLIGCTSFTGCSLLILFILSVLGIVLVFLCVLGVL